MDKELLKKVLGAVAGIEGTDEEKKVLVDALNGDDKLLLENSDKITALETSVSSFEGIDVAKTRAVFEMLKENGLEDTSKILDLVKNGNASEEEKKALNDQIANMKKEGELKDAKNLSDLLTRDSIASLMTNSTFGKEMPAKSITVDLSNSESLRRDNGALQLNDKAGNWWGFDSKEGKAFVEETYKDINQKPVKGTDLNITENNSGGLVESDWATAMSID